MAQPQIPITDLFAYYRKIEYGGGRESGVGAFERRLRDAKDLVEKPGQLAACFDRSLAQATDFFTAHPEQAGQRFYPQKKAGTGAMSRELANVDEGLAKTSAVGKLFRRYGSSHVWQVLGQDDLSFRYLDRELPMTRAPGWRLADGKQSDKGPQIDLLLANSGESRRPIIGELKVTSDPPPGSGKTRQADADPFYALIQSLAAAAYLLPAPQMRRLAQHAGADHVDADSRRLDIYTVLVGEPDASDYWFELRELADRLSRRLQPFIADHIENIALLELAWPDTPSGGKRDPRFAKRYSYPVP